MTTKRSLSSQELRRLAEAADGRRGVPLRLVEMMTEDVASNTAPATVDNVHFNVVAASQTPKADDTLPIWNTVLDIQTIFSNPSRKNAGVKPTQLVCDGVTIQLPCDEYDALFWSEASVEKFFFPYYVRVLDAKAFKLLYDAYYNDTGVKTIYGFVHYPPTDFNKIDTDLKSLVITQKGNIPIEHFVKMLQEE